MSCQRAPHKPVRQPSPGHAPDDLHVVVVAHGSGHLLVSHVWPPLVVAPQPRQAGRVDDDEGAGLSILPPDQVPVSAVHQQVAEELPEQAAVCDTARHDLYRNPIC